MMGASRENKKLSKKRKEHWNSFFAEVGMCVMSGRRLLEIFARNAHGSKTISAINTLSLPPPVFSSCVIH